MFKNLDKYDISSATSWVKMPELGRDAKIQVKPATEANPRWYNAFLAAAAERKVGAMGHVSAEDIAAGREQDAVTYPKFVIVGWHGVESDSGELVPYSRSAAKELCAALLSKAPHLFDRIRDHASTPAKFYAYDEPDAEELAKN